MRNHEALEPRLRPLLAIAALDRTGGLDSPMVARRRHAARRSERLGAIGMLPGPDPEATWDELVPVEGGRIPVRFYRPDRRGPHPLYVFIHGGGWCAGTVDERDPRCRTIATEAGCLVASIDYRLAPENQYPTAPEDCYSTLCWLADNATRLAIDSARIAVGGESAGANLAAVVCLMARDRSGPPICHQWLDVPATDATLSQSGFREVADGYLLDTAVIEDYLDHYLSDPAQATEPYCSPLFAADHSGLPPAWIMSAGFDKLRGDAVAYTDALRAAGVPVTHTRLDGHIHASFALTRLLPSARGYERLAIAALANAFEHLASGRQALL